MKNTKSNLELGVLIECLWKSREKRLDRVSIEIKRDEAKRDKDLRSEIELIVNLIGLIGSNRRA